ncbi:MAG: peptide chain release factor N(5)-glutamine methyltransferase [Spirochaetae bacterium HGW-Spirochaetae-9]|nr:MAG: peptide chain release factor N(5)-glutamine methyltransferase [Spirochaetae bacterium HGW-Spirochaetae-9]
MTYREFLAGKAAELCDVDAGTPFLDATIVYAHCLGIPRGKLLARLPENIQTDDIPELFEAAWARRLAGESVAYIVGSKEFFGREFLVDQRVLVPRPDTETLVAAALELGDLIARASLSLHDVCTGSGAVAISIAAERPSWSVSASDISSEALDVARANSCHLLGHEIALARADLLDGFEGPFDIITANPPYVPTEETATLLSRGWQEPSLALDGGPDGLTIVSRLVGQAGGLLAPGGFLLIETDALQSESVRAMFLREGFDDIRVWKDLAGLERITAGRKH